MRDALLRCIGVSAKQASRAKQKPNNMLHFLVAHTFEALFLGDALACAP